MAFLYKLRLACLAMLMLTVHLEITSATVHVFNLRAKGLTGDPAGNKADGYVKVWCNSAFGGMTEHQQGNANPWWSAEFTFPNCNAGHGLLLEVWDKDLNYDDHLFTCKEPLSSGTYDVTCSSPKGTLYYKYNAY